jgi:hypothetical protein
VGGTPAEEDSYELRTTSIVRALSETLPEAVAAAAYEFITGLCSQIPTGLARGCYRQWTTGSAPAVAPTR